LWYSVMQSIHECQDVESGENDESQVKVLNGINGSRGTHV
jgi:hypothetical protein